MAFPSAHGNSTTRRLFGLTPALSIQLSSTELHGPHLSLGAAPRTGFGVADDSSGDWLLAAAIGGVPRGEHGPLPDAVSIGTAAPQFARAGLGRTAHGWASALVSADTRAGNIDIVAVVVGARCDEGQVRSSSPRSNTGGDARGRHAETSVPLAISTSGVAPVTELVPPLHLGSVAAVWSDSGPGDRTAATALDGSRVVAKTVQTCTRSTGASAPIRRGKLR